MENISKPILAKQERKNEFKKHIINCGNSWAIKYLGIVDNDPFSIERKIGIKKSKASSLDRLEWFIVYFWLKELPDIKKNRSRILRINSKQLDVLGTL